MKNRLLLAAVLLGSAKEGGAQVVDWDVASPTPIAGLSGIDVVSFGRFMYSVKDVNSDGFDDIFVSNSLASPGGISQAGWAGVLSGLDGSIIRSWSGTVVDQRLRGCGGIGDADGDGYGDVSVLDTAPTTGLFMGFYSVSTGALLASYSGGTVCNFRRLGYDRDGDGLEEYHYRPGSGQFYVYEGLPPSIELSIIEGDYWLNMGASEPEPIPDFDGDGHMDILIGAPGGPCGSNYPTTSPRIGRFMVYSGWTGATLATYVGDSLCDRFGHNVSSLGDVDGDGVQDFIVSQPGLQQMKTISGATGAALATSPLIAGLGTGTPPYTSHLSVGDVDGDGFGDFVVLQYPAVAVSSWFEVRRGLDHTLIMNIPSVMIQGLPASAAQSGLFAGDEDEDGFGEVILSWYGGVGYSGHVRRISLKPAGAFKYGSGCGAAGHAAPGIGARGSLKVGGTITTTLHHAPAGAFAVFALGSSDVVYGSQSLPLSLASAGFPGCQLLVSPEWIQPVGTTPQPDGRAGASIALTIPNLPSLVGATFYAQWAAQDPISGAVVFSQGLRSVIQS